MGRWGEQTKQFEVKVYNNKSRDKTLRGRTGWILAGGTDHVFGFGVAAYILACVYRVFTVPVPSRKMGRPSQRTVPQYIPNLQKVRGMVPVL